MAARLVHARALFPARMTTPSPASRSARAARPPRQTSVRAATDDDAPELPDYDIVALGPSLETSALALGAQGWIGGSDDANAYVAAVDRGYLLLGARAPSELALLKEYERYWRLSDAAQLPGCRPPRVYASVEIGADGTSVLDTLQAHAIAAGGAVPDLFCFRLAPGADPAAVAAGVASAVELGACPAEVAVDGFDGAALEAFVAALADAAPDARVAFDRVVFSLADRSAEMDGTLATCARLGVGAVAAEPLGEGDRVVDLAHPECDEGQARLLAFLGSMVGGGVQRSPMQVALNWVLCKGATPEVATRRGTRAWEAGGAMLWRLDENAVGIIDERNAAAENGDGGGGPAPA